MPQLKSVEIKRFRGIRSGKIEGFTDVNLFIGRNNSGKSTVAEAITRVVSLGNAVDPIGRRSLEVWQQVRKEASPMVPQCWYRSDQSQPVQFQAIAGKTTFAYEMVLHGNSIANPTRVTPDFRQDPSDTTNQFSSTLSIFRPPDGQLQQIESALWMKLLATRRDKDLTSSLKKIFGFELEQIQVLPDQKLVLLFPDYTLPLDLQGDGSRATLRCLMMLSALRNTMFILEEPECHQHPGSLERFALAVCKLAKDQEVQLIISTHSAECARSFLKGSKESDSTCSVFHLQLQDGSLTATRLSPESAEAIEFSGIDLRFLDMYD